MLGLVTGPAREGATSARRENIDPINLVQRIMRAFLDHRNRRDVPARQRRARPTRG